LASLTAARASTQPTAKRRTTNQQQHQQQLRQQQQQHDASSSNSRTAETATLAKEKLSAFFLVVCGLFPQR